MTMMRLIDRLFNDKTMPHGLGFWEKLWWKFVPGTVIDIKWPSGNIVVDHNDPRWVDMGAVWVDLGFSTNPNDHCRWYLEKHVGRQGRDWQWGMSKHNIDHITIKVRQKYQNHAIIMALMWS
jgi:hypothetical protein